MNHEVKNMQRRHLLLASLGAVACGGDPGSDPELELQPLGAEPGIIPIVIPGDSTAMGTGDPTTKGGWVFRHISRIVTEFGPAHPFRFVGTNPVRGFLGKHWTEGHGGLEYKPPAQWGSLAAGATVDNIDQALLNKPISKIGTGQRMFGSDGYHRGVKLVIWAFGANNVNNYKESAATAMSMWLASLVRVREQLNEPGSSPSARIALIPSLWDWGGNTPAVAALNHQKVLETRALIPDMISTFNALYPDQPLITGFDGYSAIGPWSTTQFKDIVHPNELGYDRHAFAPLVGPGSIEVMMPIYRQLYLELNP